MGEVFQAERVALVGCGAIGSMLIDAIKTGRLPRIRLTAIAVRRRDIRTQAFADQGDCPLVDNPAALIDTNPEVVVEAASQQAVADYGPAVLDAGLDLLIASVGVLGNDNFRGYLVALAKRNGCRVLFPSGAIGGLDALQAAASSAGLDDVLVVTRKHPRAFSNEHDGHAREEDRSLLAPAVLFVGSAREAVTRYPKTLNVAAAVSLAGIGFDRTRVEVIADPEIDRTRHEVFARGPSCNLVLRFESSPHPDNPGTSMLAAMSVLSTVANLNTAHVLKAL
ncbi:MAG TPA: aspartate dehydrogenase [bacterium]|jgi:aspartate dehydrogenase